MSDSPPPPPPPPTPPPDPPHRPSDPPPPTTAPTPTPDPASPPAGAPTPDLASSPASPSASPPPYHPGSADPRLNRPLHERYPQIRSTSGYGDPRVNDTGPGPGAGTEQEPERSAKLSGRLLLAMTVVIGQLWALSIAVDAWMRGDTDTAWWCAGFLILSFLVVLALWSIDKTDR